VKNLVLGFLFITLALSGCAPKNVAQNASTPVSSFSSSLQQKVYSVVNKTSHNFEVLVPTGGLNLSSPSLGGTLNSVDQVEWDFQDSGVSNGDPLYFITEAARDPHFSPVSSDKVVTINGTTVYEHEFGKSTVSYVFFINNTYVRVVVTNPDGSAPTFPSKFLDHLQPLK
jgi:hypothetical protein